MMTQNNDLVIENGILKKYCGNNNIVVIPGEVKIIGQGAFRECIHITEVTIPDGVTEIRGAAFSKCFRLESVTISGSVLKIGDSAFAGCRNLKNAEICPGVKMIGDNAFKGCRRLSRITLPDSLTEIGAYAFSESGLRYINFPDSLTKVGKCAFSGCSNMRLTDIPGCIPEIGTDAFKKVHPSVEAALKAAVRKSYKMDGAWIITVTSLRRHRNADRLLCTDIFGYNVITNLNCTLGQRMVFFPPGSRLDKEFAEENQIVSANGNDTVLSGGHLTPKKLKITPVTIRGEVSEGLLLPIEVLNKYTDIEKLKNGDSFSSLNDRDICRMTIPDRMDIDHRDKTLLKYHEGGASPKTIYIPFGLEKIGHGAFMRCKKPVKIIIPETVKTIAAYAFFECTNLSDVVIPGSVETIKNSAFEGCGALTEVKIPEGVKSIGMCAFRNCTHLNHIDIPDSVTEVGFKAFDGCDMLKSVRIKNYKSKEGYLPDYSTLEKLEGGSGTDIVNVDGVVFNRDMSELIKYPASKDDPRYMIPAWVKRIKMYAFSGNEHLIEVIIPDGVTHIEHRAFENCRNLQSITIPSSVIYMGEYVFIGIHTSPNTKQQNISGSILKASARSVIDALSSRSTSEGILIRGKKGSEAERYAEKNGCPFEEIKKI